MSYFPEPSLRAPEKQKRKTKWQQTCDFNAKAMIHDKSRKSPGNPRKANSCA
jgi:hypothetical protein